MINVQDPLNPTFEGCFGGDGYVHDAQCVVYRGPDVTYYDREICFCYNADDFAVVDVTDKNNMTLISRSVYNGYMYTHQVHTIYRGLHVHIPGIGGYMYTHRV